LAELAFPKTCPCCGKVYPTAEAFLAETEDIPIAKTPLKEATESDGSVLLEVYRNCVCGSTLMDEFHDRRDMSARGCERRALFRRLMKILVDDFQITEDVARVELLKVLRDEHSELVSRIFPGGWE
jgi:hypothetical protein